MVRICVLNYDNDKNTLRTMINKINQYAIIIRDSKTKLEKFDETMENLIKLIYQIIDFSELKPVIFKRQDVEVFQQFLMNFSGEVFIPSKKHLFPRRVFQLTHLLSNKVRILDHLQNTRPS